jgi:hypothetical protein
MDRMEDSGSSDLGSSPGRVTINQSKQTVNLLTMSDLYFSGLINCQVFAKLLVLKFYFFSITFSVKLTNSETTEIR